MTVITIECYDIQSDAEFHDVLAAKLRFPSWYGRNLDALYDCLTDLHVPVTINLLHVQTLIDRLGNFGRAAINCMEQAERENGEMLILNLM